MTQVFLKFIRQFVAIFGVSAVMLVGAIVSFIAACGGGKAPALDDIANALAKSIRGYYPND